MSIPDQRWTVHFTWSPGAAKLPTAPGGSLRKDGPGWEKAEDKFTNDLRPACVCVSCVASMYSRVLQCVACISAPEGSVRKDGPGWEKAEDKFTNDLRPACVCVSCVASMYSRVLQCVAC